MLQLLKEWLIIKKTFKIEPKQRTKGASGRTEQETNKKEGCATEQGQREDTDL